MAVKPTTSWSESAPAGTQNASLGDDRIRELKTQLREVVDEDHKFDSSGQDEDMGKHDRCTFIEAADIGDGATGLPILGAETSTEPELTWKSEDDETVRLTDEGQQFTVVPNYSSDPGSPVIGQMWVRNDL